MFKLLLIAAVLTPAVLGLTPVRQCPNGAGLPQSVDINGCTGSPCPIVNGQPLLAHAVGITSPVATNGLEAYIIIRLAGLQIPFPMPDGLEDACANGTPAGTCPVSAGQTFDYNLDFEGQVLQLSGVTVQVEVGLRADDGSDVTCVAFDAAIVDG
ncbi:epididymal secretory protein E1 [Aedes aegypti]|uniref:MD-2-related lipid-recognition domain-containing protein n=1 Tax=Aedes aegypti TaxID=7159 RepID=A0A1S4G3H5_AEDAE|nr:epididymal secretory protein E1 [Aedes aegypti]